MKPINEQKYKFTYYELYGKGETIRMLLGHANANYEFKYIPNQTNQTPVNDLPLIELGDGQPISG